MFEHEKFARLNGLRSDEYQIILNGLKRIPTKEEIGIFSALWSEHCGYKYSAEQLKKLPSSGKNVLAGPGENAGAIKIDDDNVVVFKMESHNHPSAIAPYHGAATGVGGILRDVFTMGARPVAILDSLHFGPFSKLNNLFLKEKVVEGISFYGNCVGVPTVGGELDIDESYSALPLVNVMAVGICKEDELIYTTNGSAGDLLVVYGARTGRDGVHGAIFASDTKYDNIGAIQIADPFFEKLLIEATRDIAKKDIVSALQDMGAAGLTSTTAEIAYKSNCGAEIFLDRLPVRDKSITPYDMLLSETQERMLAVIPSENLGQLIKVFDKWEIEYAVIGELTEAQQLIVRKQGKAVADIPLSLLEGQIPRYSVLPVNATIDESSAESLNFNMSEKEFGRYIRTIKKVDVSDIYERYDYMVGNATISGPGTGAALISLPDSDKAVALTTDSNSRYSEIDSYNGARIIVAEAVRNLISSGAQPIGITDCLNFGRPDEPSVYEQFTKTIEGLRTAALFYNIPIVSGNVSFYNEVGGKRIKPTPVIGMVGVKDNSDYIVRSEFAANSCVYEIGENLLEHGGSLFQSFYHKELWGPVPVIDFEKERRVNTAIMQLINERHVCTAADVSAGGILGCLLDGLNEEAGLGFEFELPFTAETIKYITSETQARYVVGFNGENSEKTGRALLTRLGIPYKKLGIVVRGRVLKFSGDIEFSLNSAEVNNAV